LAVTTTAVDIAPSFTSPATAYFAIGKAGNFTITTKGTPTATLTESGKLPSGLSFKTTTGTGEATISGTPSLFDLGTSHITLTATDGVTPNDTQRLTIVVGTRPLFLTPGHAPFIVGHSGSFIVGTLEYPAAALSVTPSTLPIGLHFKAVGLGLASIYGTPTTPGRTRVTILATNGVGKASETLTIVVDQAPAFTSIPRAIFTPKKSDSFVATTSGYPGAKITELGSLPKGITFKTNGNGTATISGTPTTSKEATYKLTLRATNGVTPADTQSFTLTMSSRQAGDRSPTTQSSRRSSPRRSVGCRSTGGAAANAAVVRLRLATTHSPRASAGRSSEGACRSCCLAARVIAAA
ncbi:MAG: putative Ig domain-containing protein, partial [Nitrososphaerales archaeon]